MSNQENSNNENNQIRQPLTPEQVSPEQRQAHQEALENGNPTLNPGDIVDREMTLEEKSQKVAVNTGDITGDRIVVPTYFVVDDPEEGKKALHHIDDAEEISDVIRQARVDEETGERKWW
ncbi:MAG: hypothetical protein ACFBSG_14890 [Leptolyngbyaceae cyanobacterium]